MTLSTEQIKLLESYRDKAYICNILCDESFNHYSFIKNLVNLPLILSSSVMTVLNSSDFDAQTMRIPNIVLNASTTSILSLINNYKLPEKCQTFRNKAIKYMHLCNQIEDSLTNNLLQDKPEKSLSIQIRVTIVQILRSIQHYGNHI
jgi:hypothetical protein